MTKERVHKAAVGQAETVAALQELIAQYERGEIDCVALRLFHTDGTWEDVALGGTEEQRAEMLADLQSKYRGH